MARVVSSLQPGERDSLRTMVTLGAVIAALHFGDEILVPIALAILLSFVLAPMVRLLHKIGLGRALPVAVTVMLAFVILASLGGVIATQVKDLAGDLPRYETTLVRKITYLRGMSSNGGMRKIESPACPGRSTATRPSRAVRPGRTPPRPAPTRLRPTTPASRPCRSSWCRPPKGRSPPSWYWRLRWCIRSPPRASC